VKRRHALSLLLGAAAAPACGYALVGKGTVVDPTIKRIGVPLFRDNTGRATLDQRITRAVIDELLKRGRFDVVQSGTGVDALVEGQLVSYTVRPVGFETTAENQAVNQTQASRWTITLTANVRYAKTGATDPIWANDTFTFRDEYELGTDPAAFVDREEQAVERLAKAFAGSLVAAMLEAF
jgi:hypothetical protein